MSKLTRITQKVFGSQAGSAQLAKFGSFAAGSPVVFGPSGIGSIQALNQYLGGWFPSVVNGAAPAIEDMNSLHYLYAYQLAYLFQEGIPEYDSNTTYFIDSFVQSSGTLYVSLTDNNLGNPVTDTANWTVFAGSSVLQPGAILSGDYPGDVFCTGAVTMGSNVTINGDLIIQDSLTNTGGFSLTVFGKYISVNGFLFTPSSTLTPQGNVYIGGDFIFGANEIYTDASSNFNINPGQAPTLTIGGNMISFGWPFDGSGRAEANGLNVEVFGDVSQVAGFNLNGGDSNGTANAGRGGTLKAYENINASNISTKGGDCAFSGFAAGAAGSVLATFFNTSTLDARGGSATAPGSTTGGPGGNFNGNGGNATTIINSVLDLSGGAGHDGDGAYGGTCIASLYNSLLTSNGGNSVLASGGNSGKINNPGLATESNYFYATVALNAGSGAVNGGDACAGSLVTVLDATFASFSARGGAGTSGNGGKGASITSLSNLGILGASDIGGGNGNGGSGTGGDAGNVTVGGIYTTNNTLGQTGGTGSTPGTNGTITLQGNSRVQTLGVGNSASATTPGSVVKKIEVFDKSGTSLGFIPVYDTIT